MYWALPDLHNFFHVLLRLTSMQPILSHAHNFILFSFINEVNLIKLFTKSIYVISQVLAI